MNPGSKICILAMPFLDDEINKQLLLPPYFLGEVKSYLRGYDMDSDIIDLNIHIQSLARSNKRIDLNILKDPSNISGYINDGKTPAGFQENLERLAAPVLGSKPDILVVYLANSYLVGSEIGHLLMILKYLKERSGLTTIVSRSVMRWGSLARSRFVDYVIEPRIELLPPLIRKIDGSLPLSERIDDPSRRTAEGDSGFVLPDFNGLPLEEYKYDLFQINRLYDIPIEKIEEINDPKIKIGILPYLFSEGCSYRCNFCRLCNVAKFKYLDPEVAAQNLGVLHKSFRFRHFMLLNNNINISHNFLKRFCRGLIGSDADIRWSDSIRADNLTEEQISVMRESGAVRLSAGLETPSVRLAKTLNKDLDIKEAIDTIRLFDKHDLWTNICLIIGLPFEDERDIGIMQDFIRGYSRYIDQLLLNYFDFSPGSNFYERPEEFNIRIRRDQRLSVKPARFDTIGFDEIGGLKWEEKIAQKLREVESTRALIREIYQKNNRCLINDGRVSLHFLSYLDEHFGNKKDAKEWLASIGTNFRH
jgi:radical SAM superfamily enzyme YgiQ (UPF0313 family)